MTEPLERVSSANEDAALRYLARRPYDNVYAYWLLVTRQLRSGADMAVWRDECGAVQGACSYGAQIVPSSDDVRALDAFGERAQASDLRYTRADADVAPATLAEVDELAVNSAAMIAGEMGGGSVPISNEFRARTTRLIEAGWLWQYRHEGKLTFMCHVGATMPATAQLQGVWTPPEMRGRGYATRALGAICDRLLDNVPKLSLYVNGYNASAIALYERVGFQRVGEFQTIIFGS